VERGDIDGLLLQAGRVLDRIAERGDAAEPILRGGPALPDA